MTYKQKETDIERKQTARRVKELLEEIRRIKERFLV
jgi:hypothetical protein